MRNLLAVEIFCLTLGLFGYGCGSGETEQSGASGINATQPAGVSAVRAQVKSRCGGNSESDFCSKAYAIIGQWLSGQIDDEEFVTRLVELRNAETSPVAGDGDEDGATERLENPLEGECERIHDEYDPAWGEELNFRERAVYSGIGKLYVGLPPDGAHDTVAENIRIYSYNPAAQLSKQNIYRALSNLICRLVHNPDFHNVTVFRGRRIVEDGTITSYTTLPVVGRPEGNVLLFFRDEEISSLLESYDGLTYSQIRETAVTSQNYDYIAYSVLSHNNYNAFHHLRHYAYDDCSDRTTCIPGRNGNNGGNNDYYYDWLLIANENAQ